MPRVWRYIVASVVATGVTELCYVGLYATDLSASTIAGAVAFLAGAVPKFALLRWWVWRFRGTPRLLDEVVPYVAIAGGTGLAAGWLTSFAESGIEDEVASRTIQVLLVGGAFLLLLGALGALRYVLFDRLVFNRPRQRAPARR